MREELIQKDYPRFGDYVRALALAALEPRAEDARPINHSDHEFITELNEYLLSEHCEPLDMAGYGSVSAGAASAIAAGLDIGFLNQTDNVFNHGADCVDRVHSQARTKALASMSFALDRYLIACNEPVKIGRELSIPQDELTDEALQPQLWRRHVTRQADGKLHSTLEQVREIDWSKKPVVCFGGIGAMALNPREINGVMKQAEKLLGGMEIVNRNSNEGAELYCVSYPAEHRAKLNGYVNAFNADTNHYVVPFMQDVYERFLRPSVAELLDRESPVQRHELRPILRKWNFFTTSIGAVCVKSLSTLLADDLQRHGLSASQIRPLLAEVFALNANPVCRLDDNKPCGNFSAIHLVSRNDVTVRSRAYHQERIADDAGELVLPISENELLVWSDHPRRGLIIDEREDHERTSHDIANIRVTQGLAGRPENENTGHHMQLTTGHVMVPSEDGVMARYFSPDIPQNALRHAIINEGTLGRVADLLKPIRLASYPRAFATNPERAGSRASPAAVNDNRER